MPKRVLNALRHPSLKLTIVAIVFLVVVPTLGVVMATLFNTSKSFHEATTRQLLETARTVARSTASELELTASVLLNLAEVHADGEHLSHKGSSSFANGSYEVYMLRKSGEQWQFVGDSADSEDVQKLVVAAAETGKIQVSNILPPEVPGGPSRVVFAVSEVSGSGMVRVATLVTKPGDLIHSLARHDDDNLSVILAITDGTGRIMGRSVDGERLIGKPVPDWQRLKDLGTDSGSFKAQTLEGKQIVFAFQEVSGTPGWVAVVGESASSFDQRWQQPIKVMLAASAATVLVALILAMILAQRALKPIRHLAERARRIVSNEPNAGEAISADVPPSFVAEFEALRLSLDEADKVLHQSLEESRHAEQLARENNNALRAAERLARLGHWSLDVATGQLTSSEMISVLYGDEGEPSSMPVERLKVRLAPESYQRVSAAVEHCITTGESYSIEVVHKRTDGSSFAAFVRGTAVLDETGKVVKITGTLQDISEGKEQRERLEALADNLPSGVIFRLERDANTHLHITYLSAGLEELTGVSVASIMAQPRMLSSAISGEGVSKLMQLFRHASRAGQVVDDEFQLKTAYGHSIWIHCRAALRFTGTGKAVWDGIARDMTAEREVANALHAAKEAAESAERAKSDFLATMSHEIRTPMNSVIGMARLAMRTDLNPKQRNYLEKINESANVLLSIINDILDFSKIEAGGMVIEGAPFKLEAVLETVSSVTALRAEEKGLEITFAVAPETPTQLHGDSLRLGQVITNLVGNAVKFTEHGDVVVSVSPIWDVQGRNRKLLVSVRDSGIGLSPEQARGLFTPFMQAQTDTSRRYGGTGLGLAISKRLVELMGGEIWVESELGQGSTFFFTMRLEEVPADANESQARHQVANQLRGRRILIVDDNLSARTALADMVAGFGMATTAVESGLDALNVLRTETVKGRPFDIVLLDWRMPVMDGVETARHIKADSELEHMPAVLMVTAYGQDAMMQASSDIGLQGVLLKPVTQSIMFNTLLGVFCGADAGGLGNQRNTYQPSDAAAYAGLRGKRVLVTDDNALNREVATDFLEYVGVIVHTAVDGRDAIWQLQQHEFDAVLMDIHMPEMNGLEATREIRKDPKWANLPIIALTAQTRKEDQVQSLEAGMNGHLTKPIDEVDLYTSLLEHCEVTAVAQVQGEVPRGLLPHLVALPLRRANLLRGFLSDFDHLPESFAKQLAHGQLAALAELVHQIKGSAGYLDAKKLCAVADEVEAAARRGEAHTVQRLAESFLHLTHECLNRVRQALVEAEAGAQPGTEQMASSAQVLAMIKKAMPLVASGDFEAKQLLETLVQSTTGTQWAGLTRPALDAFDDLELERALELLGQLKVLLSEA